MKKALKSIDYNTLNNVDQLKLRATEISILAKLKSINVIPYTKDSVDYFSNSPVEAQEKVLKNLNYYHSILNSHPNARKQSVKVSREEEQEYIMLAAKAFGLRPQSKNLDFISNGDVIEVYLSSGVQVYRNFRFFTQCSYDLTTLSTTEWFHLYERSQQVTDLIMKKVGEVLTQPQDLMVADEIPVHTLRERYLDARKIFDIKIKNFAPLIDLNDSSIAGFICTSTSEVLLEGSEADKIHHL